jgi:hypothetical protein
MEALSTDHFEIPTLAKNEMESIFKTNREIKKTPAKR